MIQCNTVGITCMFNRHNTLQFPQRDSNQMLFVSLRLTSNLSLTFSYCTHSLLSISQKRIIIIITNRHSKCRNSNAISHSRERHSHSQSSTRHQSQSTFSPQKPHSKSINRTLTITEQSNATKNGDMSARTGSRDVEAPCSLRELPEFILSDQRAHFVCFSYFDKFQCVKMHFVVLAVSD